VELKQDYVGQRSEKIAAVFYECSLDEKCHRTPQCLPDVREIFELTRPAICLAITAWDCRARDPASGFSVPASICALLIVRRTREMFAVDASSWRTCSPIAAPRSRARSGSAPLSRISRRSILISFLFIARSHRAAERSCQTDPRPKSDSSCRALF